MKENLGMKARDKVTGLEGTIIGMIHYLTGCNQYGILGKIAADGKVPDTYWIDVDRCELIGQAFAPGEVSSIERPGGPGPVPYGRSI